MILYKLNYLIYFCKFKFGLWPNGWLGLKTWGNLSCHDQNFAPADAEEKSQHSRYSQLFFCVCVGGGELTKQALAEEY